MAALDHQEAIRKLSALVSPRVGIIQSLTPVQVGIEVPDSPLIYRATLAHFDFRAAKPIDRSASGKGETREEAMLGAIGEAVERYCACHAEQERLVWASFAQLQGRALDPRSCVLFSDGQYASEGFPCPRFDENGILGWTPARALPSGQEVLVPASFVYLDYPYRGPVEYLAAQTSNGLAAGPGLDAAILRGLCEVIERDGFLIHWMNRLPAPRIDLSGLDGLPRSLARHFHRYGVEVHAFNVTSDIPVCVVMGLLIDRSGTGPASVVGLGCHLNPVEALRKALMETCQVYTGEVVKRKFEVNRGGTPTFQEVRELEDHTALFSDPGTLPELTFLLEGRRVQRIDDLPDRSSGDIATDLATCVGLLDRAGSQVLYADLTTADIIPFGLRVVRVLATELQPMHFGFGQERRGGRRLYEVPRSMGYSTAARRESDLNPCPHPLA